MADDLEVLVYDTVLADIAAIRISEGLEGVLTRELFPLGLAPILDDSFAILVLRVSSQRQTGTAYLELRHEDARMRIVLRPHTPPLPDGR